MTTHQAGEQTRLGPYLVQDVIGSGPHGTVYGVLDEEKNQRLVLKRLHEPAEEQPGEVFSQVARVVVALAHPAIADVGHIMLHGRHVAIIGEFVDGRPLSEVLANDAPLPPAETLALSRQICAALMYAHQRCVYHTSLRPENVFLMSDGGIRITDFAIAALYGHSVRGRPNYTPAQERYFAPRAGRGPRCFRCLQPRCAALHGAQRNHAVLTGDVRNGPLLLPRGRGEHEGPRHSRA